MGPGPNYCLYRPYHLTSLETPITIFEACVNNEATIAPTKGGVVADTITIAKKDLKAGGDRLDAIGGYTVYGSIEEHSIVKKRKFTSYWINRCKTTVLRDIKKVNLLLMIW